MPYSQTTWADTPATSSPISAANLNKIETELARLKVNADLDPAAAIAYSKLALALSIVNGDVSATAAIAYSKLNLASSIVNADISASAAIASSKLADSVAIGKYRKVTAKQVLNTVTDTDLFNGEITLAANDLGTNKRAIILAEGDYINNSAAVRIAQQFKLKLGATTLIDVGVPVGNALGAGAARFGWRVTASIQNLTATTQSVYFDAVVTCQPNGAVQGVNSAFATGEGTVVNLENVGATYAQVLYSGWNSGGVDTTASQALVLSVVNPTATATFDTTLKSALVEIV